MMLPSWLSRTLYLTLLCCVVGWTTSLMTGCASDKELAMEADFAKGYVAAQTKIAESAGLPTIEKTDHKMIPVVELNERGEYVVSRFEIVEDSLVYRDPRDTEIKPYVRPEHPAWRVADRLTGVLGTVGGAAVGFWGLNELSKTHYGGTSSLLRDMPQPQIVQQPTPVVVDQPAPTIVQPTVVNPVVVDPVIFDPGATQ